MADTPSPFQKACRDYQYLLERGYPPRASLELVGNHFQLGKTRRSMLRRGIAPRAEACARRSKLCPPAELAGQKLCIDAYNILITIRSYLLGIPLFIACDGLLRDTAELHGGKQSPEELGEALAICLPALSRLGLEEVQFILDTPVSRSGELAALIRSRLLEQGLAGEARTDHAPDHYLAECCRVNEEYICSTSDSSIIDRIPRVFDLAAHILRQRFQPDLERLECSGS